MNIKQGVLLKYTQIYQPKKLFHILLFISRADIISPCPKYIYIGDNLWVHPNFM